MSVTHAHAFADFGSSWKNCIDRPLKSVHTRVTVSVANRY